MIAYAMNGEPLPLLNGYPLRLVVPGWYSTYWIKMLDDIEVLDKPDDNFWMTKAYLIPDTPFADVTPGQPDVKMVPINRMVPRSFFTNVQNGATLKVGEMTTVRGIAFGGDTGLAKGVVFGRRREPLAGDAARARSWQVQFSTVGCSVTPWIAGPTETDD